jgi:GLPGLI family protein
LKRGEDLLISTHVQRKKNAMKKISVVLVLAICLLVLRSQKTVTDCTIVYDIAVQTGNKTPEIGDAFDGATNTVYMKGLQSRSEFVSSLIVKTTIFDAKTGTAVILNESGSEKYMTVLNAEIWKQKNAQYDSIQYTYTDETKTIAGYVCKKATAKLKNGAELVVYYTSDIESSAKDFNPQFKGLKGFPLQYESQMGKKKVTFTANSINFNAVPITKFEIPKSGYKVIGG